MTDLSDDEAYNGLSPGSSFIWDQHDIVRGAWQSVGSSLQPCTFQP